MDWILATQTNRAVAKLYLPILIGGGALLIILGATEMFTRSRAGVALALIGGLASGASAVSGLRGGSRMKIPKWSLLAIVAIALVMGQFGLQRIMERFATDPLQDDPRISIARTTLGAALHYLPFGSGFGTFPQVYGIFEKSTDLLPGTYVNRAHNDFAEVFLEGGVFAIGLGLALFVWFVQRSVQIWRRQPGANGKQEILLARSASIAISLLLLHSLVDYPLRMEAITAVLAVSCALLDSSKGCRYSAASSRGRLLQRTGTAAVNAASSSGLGGCAMAFRPDAAGEIDQNWFSSREQVARI